MVTDLLDDSDRGDQPADPREEDAREGLETFFEANREAVYFSRQIEVQHEDKWYHWITNRALKELVESGAVKDETRELSTGGSIHLVWHRNHRYYRRDAIKVVRLVEEYANPNIGGAVGLHGVHMVLEGFARKQFVMRGRNAKAYGSRTWEKTGHDFDFIFERDSLAYGVEVKNTLGYMDYDELKVQVRMCGFLGIKPVFAARMLPKSWINDIVGSGGFALIMKYQLYPLAHRELARRVSSELGLPVDTPRALSDGTMERFVRWHERSLCILKSIRWFVWMNPASRWLAKCGNRYPVRLDGRYLWTTNTSETGWPKSLWKWNLWEVEGMWLSPKTAPGRIGRCKSRKCWINAIRMRSRFVW